MLSTYDLQRVAAERAAAVLVLCDKFSLDPSRNTALTIVTYHYLDTAAREDASNIMRVISVKNYSEDTRCIVQLLHYHNKVRVRINTLSKQYSCAGVFDEHPWLGLEAG